MSQYYDTNYDMQNIKLLSYWLDVNAAPTLCSWGHFGNGLLNAKAVQLCTL